MEKENVIPIILFGAITALIAYLTLFHTDRSEKDLYMGGGFTLVGGGLLISLCSVYFRREYLIASLGWIVGLVGIGAMVYGNGL